MARTIGVDFDGVLHRYSDGWRDGSVYDEPVDGAFDALRALMAADLSVFVHTVRDPFQVEAWIDERSAEPDRAGRITCMIDTGEDPREFWDERGVLLITRRKYPAVAYVDDRGIRFTSWPQAFADLHRYAGVTVGPSR